MITSSTWVMKTTSEITQSPRAREQTHARRGPLRESLPARANPPLPAAPETRPPPARRCAGRAACPAKTGPRQLSFAPLSAARGHAAALKRVSGPPAWPGTLHRPGRKKVRVPQSARSSRRTRGNTRRIRDGILDGNAHIRHAELSQHRMIRVLNQRMDDAFAVHHDVDPRGRQAEQPRGLHDSRGPCSSWWRIHGDLRPHAPVRVGSACSGVTEASSPRVLPKKGPPDAVRMRRETASRAGAALQALEDGGVLAVHREQAHTLLLRPCRDERAAGHKRFLVRERNVLARLDGGKRGLQATMPTTALHTRSASPREAASHRPSMPSSTRVEVSATATRSCEAARLSKTAATRGRNSRICRSRERNACCGPPARTRRGPGRGPRRASVCRWNRWSPAGRSFIHAVFHLLCEDAAARNTRKRQSGTVLPITAQKPSGTGGFAHKNCFVSRGAAERSAFRVPAFRFRYAEPCVKPA